MMGPIDKKESEYNEDDYKDVTEEIQEKICKVTLEKLQPAILVCMKAS